jgi:hypothetical protein
LSEKFDVIPYNHFMRSSGKVGLLVLCAAIAFAGIASGTQQKGPTALDFVKGYKKWKKANPKPVRLMTSFDLLCRGISQKELSEQRGKTPHFDRHITVYVNTVGEKAMMKGGAFPVGSVIVKEKSNSAAPLEAWDGRVVLSTVMIKREAGYNPACGDWQFAAINADATKTDGDGKLESCMKCHKEQAKKDYVFRTYINVKDTWPASGYQPMGWGKGR